ncbi:ATP-binding cassette domain-containing protein [Alloscardovia omnicolens]|uniref:ATP-binding cassette domain-containing protein n=1 Tax=Alloscardovia omnicolens TaxID=419015 RepID=UPI003A65338B
MSIISCDEVAFSYPSRTLFTNVTFRCEEHDRLCLVGPNGSGKTTLLRLITHELQPDSGTVSSPQFQPLDESGVSVRELFARSTAYDQSLLNEFNNISFQLSQSPDDGELASQYDVVLAELTQRDSWNLDARIHDIAAGLELDDIDQSRQLSSLSPGQRARASLAALLMQRPEALILDEPTNHIDSKAREFLIDTVKNWPGAVLFTSHDRDFIEHVSTAILDLDTSPFHIYLNDHDTNDVVRCNGKYSDYLAEKQ